MKIHLELTKLLSGNSLTLSATREQDVIIVSWMLDGTTRFVEYAVDSDGAYSLRQIAETTIAAADANWEDPWPAKYKGSACMQAGLVGFIWTIAQSRLPELLHITIFASDRKPLVGDVLKSQLREFAMQLHRMTDSDAIDD